MRIEIAAGFALLLNAPAALAAPQHLGCPAEIPQHAITLSGIPTGWTTYIASPLYLHSAGMAGAPPEKLATLTGEAIAGKKQEQSRRYRLEGTYPQGKWMECGYGEYNQVIFSKRLDDNTQECTVTYRKGTKAGQNDLTIRCK